MNDFSKIAVTVLASAVSLGGCYTQIMTPQEFVETHREKSAVQSDMSSSLNYNQNCYSCHSKAELDDRYVEWKYYGITTAHNGVGLDPIAWNNPYTAPVYEPDPYGWYNPVPSQPWWVPPAAVVTTRPAVSSGASSGPENRPRTDGSTRDPRGENPRSEPIPAQAQPEQPAAGTTSPPPTAPPAATTTQPAQTPPASSTNSSERAKSDSGSSNTNRTRDDGSTRSGGRSR